MAGSKQSELKKTAGVKRRQRQAMSDSTLRIEALEPRVLFSADITALPLIDHSDYLLDSSFVIGNTDNQAATSESAPANVELVFLDQTLPQHDLIYEDLLDQKSAGRNVEIISLTPDDNGMGIISESLAGFTNVAAIHLISHGTDEGVQLGDTWVNTESILQYKPQLNQWQASLTDSADILIYGCHLASSTEGLALLAVLAEETNADIAASKDGTGHDNLDANWSLEYASAAIEAEIALSQEAQAKWQNELATSLLAVDDHLGDQPYNTAIVVGDAASAATTDVTGNDQINNGTVNLVNTLNPTNGSLQENNDETFTFTPDQDYLGPASVDYIVSDSPNDIQHHWRLDDNAGGIAVDETGRTNGTITGTTVIAGSPDYLDFNNSGFVGVSPLNYPDSFTLSFEFKLGNTTGSSDSQQFIDQGFYISNVLGTTEPGTIEIWAGDNNSFLWSNKMITILKGVNDGPHARIDIPTAPLTDGQWHTYTLTIDSSTVGGPSSAIYIDGTYVPNSTHTIGSGGFSNPYPLYLGASDGVNPSFLDEHTMREVRLIEGVLTPAAANQDILYSDATVTLNLQEPNVAPVLALNTVQQTTIENGSPIVLAESASVTDGNVTASDTHDGATLSITRAGGANPDDLFGLSSSNFIVGNPITINGSTIGTVTANSGGELQLTFDANSSTSLVDQVLQQITYQNSSDAPENTIILDWVFDDGFSGAATLGGALFDSESMTVDIIQSIDLTLNTPTSLLITEDTNHSPAPLSFTSDGDPGVPHTATIDVIHGTLTATAIGATITGDNTRQLIIVGTQTQVNDTLATLIYHPTVNYHGDDVMSVTVDSHLAARINSNTGIQYDANNNIVNDLYITDPVRGEVLSIANGEHVDIGGVINQPQEITVAAWVNLTAAGINGAEVINIADSVILRIDSNSFYNGITGFFYNDGTASWQETNSPTTMLEGTGWHHVAYAVADGYQRLYVDGNEVARSDYTNTQLMGSTGLIDYVPHTTANYTTHIGTHPSSGNYHFTGEIDDALIYSRALSSADIAALAAGTPTTGTSQNIQITIDPVNDLPIIANSGSTHNFFETVSPDTPVPVVLESSISLSDIEATISGNFNNTSITIQRSDADTNAPGPLKSANQYDRFSTLTNALAEGASLVDGNVFGTVVKNSDGVLKILFNSNATNQKVDALLQTITYENTSDRPSNFVELTWSFDDAGLDNNGMTDSTSAEIVVGRTTILITPVNQPLTIVTNNTHSLAFGDTSQIGPVTLETTDPDNYPSEIIYTLTTSPAQGLLSLDGTLLDATTTNKTFTQEDINQGRVTYTSTSTATTSVVADTFAFQVEDGISSQENSTVTIETLRDIPSNLSSGIRLNKDGGNDAYLNDTSGYEFINGLSEVTWEFLFSELEPNPGGGETTLYSASDPSGHWEHLSIRQDGFVEWDIRSLNPAPGTPAVTTSAAHPELFDGQKHTVSMTLDLYQNGLIQLYIDGILAGSAPNNVAWNTTASGDFPWIIGQELTPGSDTNSLSFEAGKQFSGTFHDIRIWDHVRTGTEILESRNARFDGDPNQRPGGDPAKKLLVNWQMEELLDPVGDGSILQITDVTSQPDNSTAPVTLQVAHVLDSMSPSSGFIHSVPIDVLAIGDDASDGDIVGFVMPRDPVPDYPNGYVYSFADPNYDGPFTIDSDTGRVIVSDATKLNPQSQDSYSLPITVTGMDSFGVAYNELITLIIHSINEPPTLTPGPSAITPVHYLENSSPVVMDAGMLIVDEELDTYNTYAGASLTITRYDSTTNTLIPSADDRFGGSGLLGSLNEGSIFSYNGITAGTVLQNTNGTLKIQFNSQATSSIASSVLQSINYSNISDAPTSLNSSTETLEFQWLFNDGNTNSGGPTDQGVGESLMAATVTSVSITPVNDPPTLTLISNPAGIGNEDAPHEITFTALQAVANDDDVDGTVDGFIVPIVNSGTLTLGENLADSTVYSASNNQINSSVNAYWTPDNHANGTLDAFSIIALDDQGGISAADPGTIVQIEVISLNDPPIGTSKTIVIDEDAEHILGINDIGFSDPVEGHAFDSIIVSNVSGSGGITLNSVPVVPGQSISQTDINTNQLKFTPPTNSFGASHTELFFKVSDTGGIDQGGQNTSTSDYKLTFDVTGVNDEPVGTNQNITINEDQSYVFDTTDFAFSDTEGDLLLDILIKAEPANGTLILNGIALTSGDSVTAADLSAGKFSFTPAPDSVTPDYFTFAIVDNGGTVNGGVDTDSLPNTATINIVSVNDSPFGKDKIVTVLEDTDFVFSADDFGFSDIDGNSLSSIAITALPTNGQLSLAGIAVTQDQSVPASAISTLTFRAEPDVHRADYDSFAFLVQDDGGTANGGIDTDTVINHININVQSVNDAPAGADNTISIPEDTDYVFNATDFGFSDTDSNALLSITVSALPLNGKLSIGGIPVVQGQSITANSIGTLIFTPEPDAYKIGYDSFSFLVKDDGGVADGGIDTDTTFKMIKINVQNVNDAPAGKDLTVSAFEDRPYSFRTTDFGISDIENDSLLSITINSLPLNGQLDLSGVNVAAGQVIPSADISDLSFTPQQDAFGASYDNFSFIAQDDGGTHLGGIDTDPTNNHITINVQAVNDAPSGTDFIASLLEDEQYALKISDFGFEDLSDGHSFDSITVTGIPQNGLLKLNGDAVSAMQQIPTSLISTGALVFTPEANWHGMPYTSLSFKTIDNGGTDANGQNTSVNSNTIVFEVMPVNDEPAGTDNLIYLQEGASHTLQLADFGFIDDNDDAKNVNNPLAVSVFKGVRFDTLPTIGTLTYNGAEISSGDTLSAVDILSANLILELLPSENGLTEFSFTVIDNGGSSDGGIDTDQTPNTLRFDVASINDAPSALDKIITLVEDSDHTLFATDFGFTDPLDNNTFIEVTVVSSPENGLLTVAGLPVQAGDSIGIEDLNNGALKFSPAAHENGTAYAALEFRVRDNGGVSNGGIDQSIDPNSLTFNVISINDAPSSQDKIIFTNEDQTYTFVETDFSFSDLNDLGSDINHPMSANNLLSITIDTLPQRGLIDVNGTPLTVNDIVLASDINNGNFRYVPASDENGLTEFTYTVRDDGGTVQGGVDQAPESNTMRISVASINDAPTGTDSQVSIIEDQPYSLSLNDFGFNDQVDDNTFAGIIVSNEPALGSLTLSGIPVSSNDAIAAEDIASGLLQFKTASNGNGLAYDNILFHVQDNGGTARNGADTSVVENSLTFNVDAVNDSPAGTSSLATIRESEQHIFTRNDFGFSDLENHDFQTVKISTLPSNGTLTLSGNPVGQGDEIDTAAIDSDELIFTPSIHENGPSYAAIDFNVQDNGGTASGGSDLDPTFNTWTVNVLPVNNAPAGIDSTVSLLEDTPFTLQNSDFGFSDTIDGNEILAVQVNTLPLNGMLELNGNRVSTAEIVSAEDINSGYLQYIPPPQIHGHDIDQVTFQVRDNGGTDNGGIDLDQTENTLTFDVLTVNDSPSGIDHSISVLEDSIYHFSSLDFPFSDVENNSLYSVIFNALPDSGAMLFDDTPIVAGAQVSATDIPRLSYQSEPNYHGMVTFAFAVSDNGGTANQGVDQDASSNTLTLNIIPVSDPPISTDNTVNTDDNKSYTLSRTDFDFSDIENDNFTAIRIDATPLSGHLTLSGIGVNAGDIVNVVDLDAQQLIYTPAENSGIKQAVFSFSVMDVGSTANNGLNTALSPSNLTIAIQEVNDQPIVEDETLTVAEGQSVAFTTQGHNSLLENDLDLDADPLIATLVEPPKHGQFELNKDGTFRYLHDGSENTVDTVTYTVSDGTSTVPATVTINISPVNDAPIALPLANQTVVMSTPFTIQLPSDTFLDPDPEDNLQITALLADGSPLPTWLTFDATSLTFSGSPDSISTLALRLTAIDDSGLLAETTFVLTAEPMIEAATASTLSPKMDISEAVVSTSPQRKAIIEEAANANLSSSFTDASAAPIIRSENSPGTIELEEPLALAPIIRDFQTHTRSIENHSDFTLKTLNSTESPIQVQEIATLADLFFKEDRNSLNNPNLLDHLNGEREELQKDINLEGRIVSSAVSVSTSLSIGYVIWLVRGGLLLGSVMSSLPAWRNIDPLPVLASLDENPDSNDDDSLEELVDANNANNQENKDHETDERREN